MKVSNTKYTYMNSLSIKLTVKKYAYLLDHFRYSTCMCERSKLLQYVCELIIHF